jgi:hypothetical protein
VKKVSSVVWLLFIPPFLFLFVNYVTSGNFSGHWSWNEFLWLFAASVTGLVYSTMLRILGQIRLTDSHDIKIHNEQIRLLSGTTNAIALGIIGFLLLDAIKDQKLGLTVFAVLFMTGIYIHYIAHKILSFMLSDK